MTLKAVHSDAERRRWKLSKRVVDENLGHYHYAPQPRGGMDREVVAAPSELARDVAAGSELFHDVVRGAFGDPDAVADLPQADAEGRS